MVQIATKRCIHGSSIPRGLRNKSTV